MFPAATVWISQHRDGSHDSQRALLSVPSEAVVFGHHTRSTCLPHLLSVLAPSPQVVVGDLGLIAVMAGLYFIGSQFGFLWLFKVRASFIGFLKVSLRLLKASVRSV